MIIWHQYSTSADLMPGFKTKLTNAFLEQLRFSDIPVGLGSKGRIITEPNPSRVSQEGKILPPTDYIVRDSEKQGFGVRVSPHAVSFFVQRKMGGSTSLRRTLGTFGKDISSVADARVKATIWLGHMARGQDPLLLIEEQQRTSDEARRKRERTFGKVFQEYIDNKRASVSEKTVKDLEQVQRWMTKTKLWTTIFDNITDDIVKVSLEYWFKKNPDYNKHDPVKSLLPEYVNDVASGRKCYAFCCAAYNHEAIKLGIRDKRASPFSQYRHRHHLPDVKARKTILPAQKPSGKHWLKKLAELRQSPDHVINVVADYLFCVALWGGRKTETQLLRWEDVDFDERTVIFRGRTTKNTEDHIFPLTQFAAELLKERKRKNLLPRGKSRATSLSPEPEVWVFPSRVRGKHIVDIRTVIRLCEEASGLHIGAHDLRRTFATELAGSSKGNLPMVKMAMNHAITHTDVTMHHYVQEKIALLRPEYEMHERKLLRLAELIEEIEPQSIAASLSDAEIEQLVNDPRIRRAALLKAALEK
jgi:integrase